MVIGRSLTNLFFTKQNGPHDYMPGIPPAYYFSTIMELDNSKMLRFGNDFIVGWDEDEPIIQLTNENWGLPDTMEFRGKRIVDISKDEFDQLTFHLENDVTIAHTIDYGDQLFIENITNTEREADMQSALPDSHLPKVWWKNWLHFFHLK